MAVRLQSKSSELRSAAAVANSVFVVARRRRHTRCALGAGVQTGALPIYALVTRLCGGIFAHRDNRALRRAIGDARKVTRDARTRGSVDDGAAPAREHMGQGVFAAKTIAGGVDGKRCVPDFHRNVENRKSKRLNSSH